MHPSPLVAAAATAWALGVPGAMLVLLLAATRPDTPMVVAGLVAALSSGGAMWIGARWWRTRPQSESLSFAELMFWTWLRQARALRTLEHGLQLLGDGSPDQQLRVLRELSSALETKDRYTHGHSRRVERHAMRTALELNSELTENDVEDLGLSAALHDVGKIEVPDTILRKEGSLTPRERSIVKWHVVVGARLVARTGNRRVAQAVLHHHETWDGTGYPHGLSGEDIPLFARIIAVADAFDAMASSRPYRPSLGRQQAVEILKSEAGRQFDPHVVEAFLRTLSTQVPVAMFIPGLHRLLREATAWARRVGVGSAAPGAGSLVLAAVVGTNLLSLPTHSAVLNDPPTAYALAANGVGETGAEVADGMQQRRGTDAGRMKDHARIEPGSDASMRGGLAHDRADSARQEFPPQPPGESPPGGELPPAGGGDDPAPQPPSPPPPTPDPSPTPEPPPPDPAPDDPGDGGGEDDDSGDSGDDDGDDAGDSGDDDGGDSGDSGDDGGGDSGDSGDSGDDDDGDSGDSGGGDPNPDKGKDCEKPPPSPGNDKHCGGGSPAVP